MIFFTLTKGHEHDGRQLKPGFYANELEFALYSWGRSVRDLGVKSVEEACRGGLAKPDTMQKLDALKKSPVISGPPTR